jgi:hypothetical protein
MISQFQIATSSLRHALIVVSAARLGNERGLYAGPFTLSSPKMRFHHFFFIDPDHAGNYHARTSIRGLENRHKSVLAAHQKSDWNLAYVRAPP